MVDKKIEIHGDICADIHDLYERKNSDYGDSFSNARHEIPYYTLGRIADKFSRYKTLTLRGEKTAKVTESIDDTLMDLANYCIMELTERQLDREKGEQTNNGIGMA